MLLDIASHSVMNMLYCLHVYVMWKLLFTSIKMSYESFILLVYMSHSSLSKYLNYLILLLK